MGSLPWQSRILPVLFLALFVGCGPNLPVGGLVEIEEEPDVEAPADAELERPRHGRDEPLDGGWDRDRSADAAPTRDWRLDPDDSAPSRFEQPGQQRRMPSQTQRWGSDRPMPSDSMPSRTQDWGSDRPMPSDSMPSDTQRWGSDRPMPSDSMPSKSFGDSWDTE